MTYALAIEEQTVEEQWYADNDEIIDNAPRTSWDLIDLTDILAQDNLEEDPPVMLHRADGIPLLYAGKVNEIHGEPESGKGWFACYAVRECLLTEQHVLYFDFEDSPKGVVSRIVALGVPRDVVGRLFHYIHPIEALDTYHVEHRNPADFDQDLVSRSTRKSMLRARRSIGPCGLIILDGMIQAVANQLASSNSNDDVVTFYNAIPRWLLDLEQNAAVLIIDHTAKAGNDRYSLGAQAKIAAVDGVTFIARSRHPFARGGVEGLTEIEIAKDRPGYLGQYAVGDNRHIADIAMRSWADSNRVEVEVNAPSKSIQAIRNRMLELQQSVYEIIAENPGINVSDLRRKAEGNNADIGIAVDCLVDKGVVKVSGERPKKHWALKAYSEADE